MDAGVGDSGRQSWAAWVIVGALAALAIAFVALSLHRPEPPTFAPSAILADEAGEILVGPAEYTVDATHDREWRHFDFSRGSVVEPRRGRDWDLAFRRNRIIVNGGPGFAGEGGIAELGAVPLPAVARAPASGYAVNAVGRDTVNPAIDDWYDYGFTSHLLTPGRRVYAVRTADGRYAVMQILSYYCSGARPGCLTFRYVYQGDGSRRFAPGR